MKDKKTHLRPFIFGTNLMMLPIETSSKDKSGGAVAVVVGVALVAMLIAIIF